MQYSVGLTSMQSRITTRFLPSCHVGGVIRGRSGAVGLGLSPNFRAPRTAIRKELSSCSQLSVSPLGSCLGWNESHRHVKKEKICAAYNAEVSSVDADDPLEVNKRAQVEFAYPRIRCCFESSKHEGES